MVFQDQSYRVLVVSSAIKFNDILAQMLPGANCYPVCYVSNAAAGQRELLAKTYDFVIVNSPLPDDLGVRFAIDAACRTSTVVLFLTRGEMYEELTAKLTPQGVFTLAKPTAMQTLQQALGWMAAARERLRKLESKSASMEEKMEEIRLVNRAKWILIERLSMSEGEAHRHIEKQAMDRCVSRREIAKGIIKTYA